MISTRSRRSIVAFSMALWLAGVAGLPQSWSMGSRVPAVGMPAEDFHLDDLEGKTQSLSQYRGKIVLLNFWGNPATPASHAFLVPFLSHSQ